MSTTIVNTITPDMLRACLSQELSRNVTNKALNEVCQFINSMSDDPVFYELYKQQLLSSYSLFQNKENDDTFSHVSQTEYLQGLQFMVNRVLLNDDALAYKITYPDRYIDALKRFGESDDKPHPKTSKAMKRGAVAHLSTKVPAFFQKRMVLAMQFLFQTERIDALTFLVRTMNNPNVKDKIRVEAADKFLTHTKPPENSVVDVNVGYKSTELENLNANIQRLVDNAHQNLLEGKMSLKEFGALKIIDVEPEDTHG